MQVLTKLTRDHESLLGATKWIGMDRYRYEYSLFILASTTSHNTHKHTVPACLPSPLTLCRLNFLLSAGPGHPFSSLHFEKKNIMILSRAVSLAAPGEDVYRHQSGECFSALISLSCPTGFPQALMCCHQLTLIQLLLSGIC